MTGADPAQLHRRILILAPRGRDAEVVSGVLSAEGLSTLQCASLSELVSRLDQGAGLAIVTEEVLKEDELGALRSWITEQAAWSDMPLVVLAGKQPARRPLRALTTLKELGNLVLLERPLNADTLISAARSALRSRSRQYETRHHLEEQARIGRDNERLHEAERRALRDAAEAREALSLALDAAELGTFHCPMPLGVILWNKTCKAHFWLPPDASVDIELFYSMIHTEDREHTHAAIEAAIEFKRPYDVEYRTVSKTGQWRWIRAKGRAYYDARGEPVRFDGITIDISRQKELEAERLRLFEAERCAREHAEHAGRMKDEFLATLSHELRTPLSAILGWTYLLKRERSGASTESNLFKAVETIERNARAQARLIDELLDMSRIIAGTLRLEWQQVQLSAVVETAVASFQPAAQAKSLQIDCHIDADVPPLAADAHRLQQIVVNLLSNATKFTPAGGRVRVSVEAQGNDVVLRVSDSGHGISAEFLPFVFERFRQADGSATRTHGGLGLGLSIVRNLVELHGGSVQATSGGIGHGATFTVRLPVRRIDSTMGAEPDEAAALTGPGPGDATAELEGVSIVLVDDESDGREMLASILSCYGAVITVAASAEEALEAIRASAPDILISDIGMPRVDGYELLRRLRMRGHSLPAIALTAFVRSEDRIKALAVGYAEHLPKPVEPKDLVGAVRRLTTKGRSASA